MRAQVSRADMKGENRALFCFALGKALEDETRYEESFFYYRGGNDLIRAGSNYDADETRAQVRRAKTLFTKEFFEARRGLGSPSKDPVFIIGLPRSGSTLVEQILASHSQVEGTTELRALPYLAGRLGGKLKPSDVAVNYPEALAPLDGPNLKGLGDEYLWRARVHRRMGRPVFIDKMPNNFAHVGMIELILPNAKIIDVRRHPMACCFSNYKQHFGNGQEFAYSLAISAATISTMSSSWRIGTRCCPARSTAWSMKSWWRSPRPISARCSNTWDYLSKRRACASTTTTGWCGQRSSEQVRRPIFTEGLDHWKNYEPWLGALKAELGFVLETYPAVPRFYSQLHTKLEYSGGWTGTAQAWSGQPVKAGSAKSPTTP